jgi:hypothetical protein
MMLVYVELIIPKAEKNLVLHLFENANLLKFLQN